MIKYMKSFLFLIFICLGLSAVSGCVEHDAGEYSSIFVEGIEVKPLSEEYPAIVPGEEEIVLNVTACIINDGKEDSSALSIQFRVMEAYSPREFATKMVRSGPMKGRSMYNHTVEMTVPGPGIYTAEVSVSEEGKDLTPALGAVFTVEEDGNITV